jgi:tetratricopeptide (TPR) repeat protein
MNNAHLQRGMLLNQQGRHQEAVAELRMSLAQDSEDSFTYGLLALSLKELEQFDEATAHAQRAIYLAPDESFGHYALACILANRKRIEESRAAIFEAIRLDPYNAGYFAILSSLELQKARWREALAAANQGLEIEPEHPLCTNLRAQALVHLGDRAAAAATMGEALARRPDDAYTHANQGWALLHAGQPKQALEHFRESLRIDPELEWARAGIVEALKARNFIYRGMLAWFLWMSRLTPGARWGLVIGAYFGVRIVRQVAESSPTLAPYLWPLIYAYAAFVLLTWLSPSFFNLLLRIDPFGRYALSRDQIRGANLLAACLIVALGCLVAYLIAGEEMLLLCAICFVALSLPASAIHVCDAGWPRLVMALITGGLLCCLLLAVGLYGLALHLRSVPLLSTSMHLVEALPLASLVSQFAAVYLTQVTVKK